MRLQSVPFLLVLYLATHSLALSITVQEPILPGQVVTSIWTRTEDEPRTYTAFLLLQGQTLTPTTPSFGVKSPRGELQWTSNARLPDDFPTGTYALLASSDGRTLAATSNTFLVGPPDQGGGPGQDTTTPAQPQSAPGPSTTATDTTDSTSSSTTVLNSNPIGGATTFSSSQPSDSTTSNSPLSTSSSSAGGAAAPDAPASPAPENATSSSSSNTPAIAGGVIGALIGLALLFLATILIVRKYRKRQPKGNGDFFNNSRMVRQRDITSFVSPPPVPIRLDSPVNETPSPYGGIDEYPRDVKEPLPEYGYGYSEKQYNPVEKPTAAGPSSSNLDRAMRFPLPR